MKISKKKIIIGSLILTICLGIVLILIINNKNDNKENLTENEIGSIYTEDLYLISKKENTNEIDEELSNEIKNEDVQIANETESLKIEEKNTSEQLETNKVNINNEDKREVPNKVSESDNSNNNINKQSTSPNKEASKQQETTTEVKIPETESSKTQVESNPVVEKKEETKQEENPKEEPKQEESEQEETIPTETKPSRTYKVNTTYINKLKQTVITEVTNNLDKLNKYGITSVEQYKIIDDDSSMCTFNGGYRSGWTYENPSAYATFKASILKGTSIKIYAVDEYQNGVYIQTLCYYGH